MLELARARRFAIIEDDYDHEFHYEGRPILPLASADPTGQVVYVGGLAKIVAPGLRIGFCVAPAPLLARLADERAIGDRHGSTVIEAASSSSALLVSRRAVPAQDSRRADDPRRGAAAVRRNGVAP